MKNTRLVLPFMLAACTSSVVTPPSAPAPILALKTIRDAQENSPGGHLYASVLGDRNYPAIERYALIKGVPAKNPDRVYQGYGGGLLAVAGDGTLFAVTSVGNGAVITRFAQGSSKPSGEIRIPDLAKRCGSPSGGTDVGGLAADSKGYLFVAVGFFSGGAIRRGRMAGPDAAWPCDGVVIYAPGARGRATPVQSIRFRRGANVDGLAVDSADNLYVAHIRRVVDEFSNAVAAPRKTRTFRGKFVGDVHAIATDARGNLFIAGTGAGYQPGWIDRYAPTAKGGGAPTSSVSLPGLHLLGAIAESGRVLYVDDTNRSVGLYHAFRNGGQSPFYSVTGLNVIAVATGT